MQKLIEITICDGKKELAVFEALKAREGEMDAKVTADVQAILADVKARGDEAVREYALKFDQAAPAEVDIAGQAQRCAPEVLQAMQRAAENIRAFHERQKQQSWYANKEHGVMLGQQIRGLHRVGVYVPAGTAPLPSSVLMNVIPAKIAGVKEIVMVTPPWQGGVDPSIAAAAQIAGVDRMFLVGSAWACAALAYGTETIPKVDKIVGPGRIHVAIAKKLLYGTVDIDMIAGPSEILVVADETANPAWLAADLLSQAEHDTMAGIIFLSTSQNIAKQTIKELERQLAVLPRRDIAAEALRNNAAVLVCESMEQAIALANAYAPEHLELCIENPLERLGEIENAGSVFLGHYTPESVGDYYAGPNHVLPTGGTPRFFSPLSVDDFVKKMQFIHYTCPALEEALRDVVTLAEAELLQAHANAAKIRFEG